MKLFLAHGASGRNAGPCSSLLKHLGSRPRQDVILDVAPLMADVSAAARIGATSSSIRLRIHGKTEYLCAAAWRLVLEACGVLAADPGA